MAKILIVEDDSTFVQLLEGFLKKHGHSIVTAKNIKSALKLISENTFDLLLLDYRLPDGTGMDVLENVREASGDAPVIIMTSFNDVRTAVKAMQSGAFDYITKPVNPEELLMIMGEAIGGKKQAAGTKTSPEFVKGVSAQSDKLFEHIDVVAPTDMAILIQGESGTGKEYVARAIHRQSKRATKPFVAIDCGALSKDLAASELFGHVKGAFTGAIADKKGVFEWADGGTLFLDEVGNLSYDVQVKLLRTLQEKIIQPLGSNKQIPVNVRIITATNDDLVHSVGEGGFRQDLYHRINEFKIQLTPLRARGGDMDIFIRHFIKLANAELGRNVTGIDAEAKTILHKYDWPGNLRELKNVIKRMVLLSPSEIAGADTLPDEMLFSVSNNIPQNRESDLKAQNEINEKQLIQKTLIQVKYNKSKAAKLLNIDRKTLYSKIERYGLDS
ncbi:sigma-54 dependent transcriptional regulator [Mucilaginibacter sp. L3T2-6]|uniref:sigma-54-dependent transcriptional regulator n=1 Tax=Mucilaginibacter sp. L3T2-6 TaxID=3062491 RepID=UPI00267641D3|nr:sigma-54 dependent transcriptional regulator [Mucilaginibacter sp. L3T2-6]MDO3643168.1 sigma-54 dependent transcriptional regulator [Mucilaginibacter sp. L3T2-6]MDV6215492.1 sigma-54 dependent transcriptional regulator [Mucilaginibacter sp. L3T2-6]